MMDYKETVNKTFGLNLLALFKLEYSKGVGKFDAERYAQALQNFRDTINEIGIPPPEEFIVMGIENLHLLPPHAKRVLKYVVKKKYEIEAAAIPNMFRTLIYGIAELQKDPELRDIITQMQKQQQQPQQLP